MPKNKMIESDYDYNMGDYKYLSEVLLIIQN